MHWAAQYIGQPWEAGVSDCWHFARRVWRERWGWEIPAVLGAGAGPIAARRALADVPVEWSETKRPQEGDAVMMALGRHPCHVGVWIDVDGGGVLHSIEGPGVIYTAGPRLVALGYRVCGFYRRVANAG